MCGIAGIFDLRGQRPIDHDRLIRMTEAVRHRGPDGSGFIHHSGAALGHRRLAIIDLAEGTQPMANEDGKTITVFNGMIYNFKDLRRPLEAKGHRFKTQCDTEVLVHGYEEWGARIVDQLRGMFAFAVFDERAQTLFLARDRLGEKPLYYHITADGLLLFASEIGGVLAGLKQTPPLNPEAVADYFTYGYVPDPKSIYQGIWKLAPGHYLLAGRGNEAPKPQRYWRPQFGSNYRGSLEDAAHELTDRLREAVEMRMIADVPLGAFLSGGVDSSGIVAMMAQASKSPVTTCSIGFNEAAFDESDYARTVADRYGTDHHEHCVDIDASGLINKLAGVYGEPFADSSALPTYIVSKLARKHVKVALTGDGGDEVFAGYRRYPFHVREEQIKAWLPASLRQALFGPLARFYPQLDRLPRPFRAKATLEALATDSRHGYLRSITALSESERQGLFSPEFERELNGYDPVSVIIDHACEAGTDDPLARAQYVDMMTWLPGRMLTKVDRASMIHGLELRAPLLDHELVEWAAQLPASFMLNGMQTKAILKKALEPHVPLDLLYRPKQGFALPLADWLRHGLKSSLQMVAEGVAVSDGWLNIEKTNNFTRLHMSEKRDHKSVLWAIVMFESFLEFEKIKT